MDAMQRFNRISAVICFLLSCAPRAYAQDNRHGETMGAAVAKTKLAGVYQHGHSGLQDPAKALAGFHRAASQGDVEAQYNLAKMYEDQDSVLFDYSKAHSWYRLAATNGHRGAQSRLGLLFEFGKGVTQSRVQAHVDASICQLGNVCPASAVTGCTFEPTVFVYLQKQLTHGVGTKPCAHLRHKQWH